MRRMMLVGVMAMLACGDDPKDAAREPDAEVFVPEVFEVSETVAPETIAETVVPEAIAETVETFTPETIAETAAETEVAEELAEPAPETIAETVDTTPDTTPETIAETVDTTPDATPDTVGPNCITLAAGHPRHVIVSYPYTEQGDQAPRWKAYALGSDGAPKGVTADFELGRAYSGRVAFRDDGAIGVTVHDDGTIGVFSIDALGRVTVIEASLDTGAYVDEAHIVDGTLLLVDGNWQNNGGGVYAAPIGCDGTVGGATLLYSAKNARNLVVRGGQHLVAAVEAGDTTRGSLHMLGLTGNGWSKIAGIDLFPDDDDIISSLVLTDDGRFALVGDNQAFAEADNRIGIARVEEAALKSFDLITPILDPVALVASPYNDAVLVVSGYGDAVHVLGYDASGQGSFVDLGEPTYIGGRPLLPGSAELVGGAFPDLVLVAENIALRRFRFDGSGGVVDLGKVLERDAFDAIPGALGIQP